MVQLRPPGFRSIDQALLRILRSFPSFYVMALTMDDAVSMINTVRPKFVFLTAKSGAGKTYLSSRLKGYQVLELDELVETIGERFGVLGSKAFGIYKNVLDASVMDAFVDEVHSFFSRNQESPVVIEGAIADAALIKRIFSGLYSAFLFVYLYPVDAAAYGDRMMKRFTHERQHKIRSLSIWPDVPPELLEERAESPQLRQFMMEMAQASIRKSKARYDAFIAALVSAYLSFCYSSSP